MVRKLITIFAISGSLVLAGCNTIRGAADDVESAADCVTGVDC